MKNYNDKKMRHLTHKPNFKRGVFFILVSIFYWGQIEASNTDTIQINLDQAIEIALTESPTIKIAEQQITLKKHAHSEIVGGLIPEISLSGNYSRTIKKQTMAMKIGDQVNTIKVGMDNSFSGGLIVKLPLFAPSLYKAMSIGKDDINLAIEQSKASKIDLVTEVKKAYLQVLLSQDSYAVLKKSYNQALSNFEIIEAKFKQGLVSEYDKIRADVQVRNLRPGLVAAENAIRLSTMQLRVVMGIADETPLKAIGNLSDYKTEVATDTFNKLYSNRNIDLANNSDMKQVLINERLLQKNIKLERTNYLPTLSASFDYTYLSMNDNLNIAHYRWYPSSSIGVSLSVPLFKASTISKVKQAKVQAAQLQYTKINLSRQLNMQANSYLDNMQASIRQIDSNIEGVNEALKGREIARKMYEVGKGTLLELNDSEVALTQAELAYNQAIYDYVIAKAEYERIIGTEYHK